MFGSVTRLLSLYDLDPNSIDRSAVIVPAETEDDAFLFGSFRLVPSRKLLLNGDARINIGHRALDILIVLVERAGSLVTKKELIARAWPGTVVGEGNLKVQIAALRKMLGDEQQERRFIVAIAGRGYQFVAPVERQVSRESEPFGTANNLNVSLSEPIGRAKAIDALIHLQHVSRLVTVVGMGGIGKTTLALTVARTLLAAGHHDVWFVDLSAILDAGLVPGVIAAAVGLPGYQATEVLLNYFRATHRPQFVVLDNCEHVIDASAEMAEQLLSTGSHVHILATSREPLRATGEHVYQLAPLANPVSWVGISARDALQHSAIELFVRRAGGGGSDFTLNDGNAELVAQICRHLDGMPLAIELAASRVDAFGLRELLRLMNDRFTVLRHGRRTAPSRHKTLLATLDWSHDLLDEHQRIVLRRLGIFGDSFLLSSAQAIAGDEKLPTCNDVNAVAELVAKSLVYTEIKDKVVRYRLLDTTRDYARQKLIDAGEFDTVSLRHANHFHELCKAIEFNWDGRSSPTAIREALQAIGEVRTALNWAFSPQGDIALGVALTVSAIPVWFLLSSLDECRNAVDRALAHAGSGLVSDRCMMKLYEALAASLSYATGRRSDAEAAWKASLAIAEKLNDEEYKLRALFAGSARAVYVTTIEEAVEKLNRFQSVAIASGNVTAQSEGDRLAAYALHRAGQHAESRWRLEKLLSRNAKSEQPTLLSRVRVGWRSGSRALLANILWLQGFPAQALVAQQIACEEARATDHPFSLAYTMALAAIPIAVHLENWATVEARLTEMENHVAMHGIARYRATIHCVRGALLLQQNNTDGFESMKGGLDILKHDAFGMRYSLYAGLLARNLVAFGFTQEAQEAIEDVIAVSTATGDLWYMPELLRIKGELAETEAEFGASESFYLQAVGLAREHGALALELRATTSLARLFRKAGLIEKAERVLRNVYEHFTEGLDTNDLKAAYEELDYMHKLRLSG